MRIANGSLCYLALAGMLFAPAGWAQSNFTPSKDNTIYEGETSNSNGAGSSIFIGRTSGNSDPPARNRRGLVRFDVTSIPPASTITSVTLDLTVTRTPPDASPATVNLHRLLVDFGEGSSAGAGAGATAVPPDATWINRVTPDTAWAANGGQAGTDYVATASASEADSSIGSTAGLVADVQAWVNDPATNFGWILIGNEGSAGSVRGYGSRENASESARPMLTVAFEPATELVFADGFEDLVQE